MKIALLSDAHDHISNLLTALHYAQEQQCTHLLYMGDITELSTLQLLLESWTYALDLVYGNNEYDRKAHIQLVQGFPQATHHGEAADICLQGRHIFFTHYPHQATIAADSGKFDAVFYGHTHVAEQRYVHHTLLANPGEIGGVRRVPSFAIYDTDYNDVRFCTI